MTPEEIARRFAESFPGFQQIGYGEIALPFYSVNVDAVIQARRPIPAIEEFVLRSIDAGLKTPDEIGAFLGLDQRVLERAILAQWSEAENVDYPGVEGSARHELVLSGKGRIALQELASIVPERREFVLAFDRVLWAISPMRPGDLLNRKQVRPAVELRPKKQVRPKVTDFTVGQVNSVVLQVLTQLQGPGDAIVKEVVSIVGLGQKRERVLPGVLLAYETADGLDYDAKVIVDGRLSAEHTAALAGSGNLSRDDLARCSAQLRASQAAAMDRLPDHLWSLVRPRADTSAVHARVAALRVASTRPSSHDGADDDDIVLDGQQIADQLAATLASLYTPGVRVVPAWEHRLALDEALSSARHRLSIVSLSLRDSVVNPNFVESIVRAADRGVLVSIAYIASRRDTMAARLLADAAGHVRGRVTFLAATEVERPSLIWDDRWVISTFDWLGYRSDAGMLRVDEGLLVTIPSEVDATHAALLDWFAANPGSDAPN